MVQCAISRLQNWVRGTNIPPTDNQRYTHPYKLTPDLLHHRSATKLADDEVTKKLLDAAKKGNADAIQEALLQGAQINDTDRYTDVLGFGFGHSEWV